MGVSKGWGGLLWGPYMRCPVTLGSILGAPRFRKNPHGCCGEGAGLQGPSNWSLCSTPLPSLAPTRNIDISANRCPQNTARRLEGTNTRLTSKPILKLNFCEEATAESSSHIIEEGAVTLRYFSDEVLRAIPQPLSLHGSGSPEVEPINLQPSYRKACTRVAASACVKTRLPGSSTRDVWKIQTTTVLKDRLLSQRLQI